MPASAPIQRCQVHKRRNVLDHLTDEQKPFVAKKLNAAYALEDYAAAKHALNTLHRELMDLNPSAARSQGEGLEETLTVHRLHVPPQLRKTLASTNVIESAFSIVERVCANVKRWHAGDQRERWVGSGLLVAESNFVEFKDTNRSPSFSGNWRRCFPLGRRLSNGERHRRVGYARAATFHGVSGDSTKPKPLTTQQQIRTTLYQDVLQATARNNEATREFEAVMGRLPSGLPHPDGAQRIKNASSSLAVARKEKMKAHNRLNDYLGRGIVPADLKRSG